MYLQPPYVLLIAGLLSAIASGSAFSAVLQQSLEAWSKNRSTRVLAGLRGPKLKLPFFGVCTGVCVFLAAGVQIFGFSNRTAFSFATPMTFFIAWLVWSQLMKVLLRIERGGSRALDIDAP
ncbi:hypothetical protein XM38_035730 [Halomicronema hongdechloris C2206]|uniref:Uncharacterized protein n=1 Tax=Halomicronema hongdechloris C2206 TaxID=1641165 RepID=A0A1Z3HQP8_9CYAN|nr:hypothetical protein [Halomicronema hongdechloris]ASC72615.1 hypothetical protein XM38_035730 [Halomicronema hongdechloris C2206]